MGKGKAMGILFPICILFSLYTLFQGWIPHWGAVIYLSLLLSIFLFIPRALEFFRNSVFVFFILYIAIILFNILVGDKYWGRSPFSIISSLLMMLSSLLAVHYFLQKSEERFQFGSNLVRIVLILLILTTISTGALSIVNPQVVRFAMEESNHYGDDTILREMFRFGMSNYYLPHAIPVIIPAFVLCIKNRNLKIKRCIGILGLLLSFALIFYSGATTSLLLGVIALLASMAISSDGKSTVRRMLLVGVLILPFLSQELVLNAVRTLENAVGEDNYFYSRLVDIEDSITGETMEGDVTVRQDLYNQSWDAFIHNPILGTDNEVGGHSVLLDFLATLGIVGFLPFIVLLFSIFLWVNKRLPPGSAAYYAIGFMTGLLMLGLKSMNNMEMWFFLICFLPILIFKYGDGGLVRTKQTKVEKNDK